MAQTVRTRIAPSPTGHLHVGTARTALFNELFAHHHGGQFIVRIEDTDKERSTAEFEKSILESLRWLNIEWDEGPDSEASCGPYRQSERTQLYENAIAKLLTSGAAYETAGETTIRLKVPDEPITFTDQVRGTVTIEPATWGGDFIIARAKNDPLYHLAVIVDDADMSITHVIRGEEHLTNTARHILLQRALDIPQPEYAHLPLLLDEERRKLSKRAGAVNVRDYAASGYLPEAMLNYLALLGWSPKDDTEIMSHDELTKRFSLAGIQKGGAIFSEQKLISVNKEYIRDLSAEQLLKRAVPYLKAAGYDTQDTAFWQRAVLLEQERVDKLEELPEVLTFCRSDWTADYEPDLLIWKKSSVNEAHKRLSLTYDFLKSLTPTDFTTDALEQSLLQWIDSNELGRGDTLWPLRVALTGQQHSPGPFEVAATLGQKTTLERLIKAQQKISNPTNSL